MIASVAQPELNLSGALQRPCKATPEMIALLRGVLADKQWHFARDIMASTGLTDRQLRIIGEENPAMLTTGDQGYKLADFATKEEDREFMGRMEGQIARMQARLVAYRNAAHRRLHVADSVPAPTPHGLQTRATLHPGAPAPASLSQPQS